MASLLPFSAISERTEKATRELRGVNWGKLNRAIWTGFRWWHATRIDSRRARVSSGTAIEQAAVAVAVVGRQFVSAGGDRRRDVNRKRNRALVESPGARELEDPTKSLNATKVRMFTREFSVGIKPD